MKPYAFLGLAITFAAFSPFLGYFLGDGDTRSRIFAAACLAASAGCLWFGQQTLMQGWTARARLEIAVDDMEKKRIRFKNPDGPTLTDLTIHSALYEYVAAGRLIAGAPDMHFQIQKISRKGGPLFHAPTIEAGDELVADLKTKLELQPFNGEGGYSVAFNQYVLRIVFFHSKTKQKHVAYRFMSPVEGFVSFLEVSAAEKSSGEFLVSQSFLALREQLVDCERRYHRDLPADMY